MGTTASSARRLVTLVWDHNREATGHSWQRLNQSMHAAVVLAIEAGMRFGKDDFRHFYNTFRGGYWFGTDNAHSQGESFYSLAVQYDNISACQSFEAWKGREPFTRDGKRLCIGADIDAGHPGRSKVTSFSADGNFLTATEYDFSGSHQKIIKRHKITLEDLRAIERLKRKRSYVAAFGKRILAAVKRAGGCNIARKVALSYIESGSATEAPKIEERHLAWAKARLKPSDFPKAWAIKIWGKQSTI